MPTARFLRITGALAALAATIHGGSARAGVPAIEVIYRETFGTSIGMTPLSSVAWLPYYGNATTGATLAVPGSAGIPANVHLSNGTGNPTGLPNVNAGPSVNDINGFVAALTLDGQQDFLIWTDEYVIDRSRYGIVDFLWYAGSQYAGDTHRVVLRIDGTWYASATGLSPPGGVPGALFGSLAQPLSYPFVTSAGAWRTISFLPGSPLTLGDPLASALPDGDVTAFGLYIEIADQAAQTNERTHFDTFTIRAELLPPTCTPADVSGDAVVNAFDVGPFAAVVLDNAGATRQQLCAADIDQDSVADYDDVGPFVNCLLAGACP